MKFLITILGCCSFLFAFAQADQKPAGSTSKEQFYKSYSDYLEKTKRTKPKSSVDSSVNYAKPTKDTTKNTAQKGTGGTELKGSISGKERSAVLVPGKPVPADSAKKNVVAVPSGTISPQTQMAAQPQQPKQTTDVSKQKLQEYQTALSGRQAKITHDSSVYFEKPKPKTTTPTVKTDKKAEELHGTITPGKSQANTYEPKNGVVATTQSVQQTKQPTTNAPVQKAKTQQESLKEKMMIAGPIAKNPSETIDTTIIGIKQNTEKVSGTTTAQEIKGELVPEKNAPKVIAATVAGNNPSSNTKKNTQVEKAVQQKPDVNLHTLTTKEAYNAYSVPSTEEMFKSVESNSYNSLSNRNQTPKGTIDINKVRDPAALYSVPPPNEINKSSESSASQMQLPKYYVEGDEPKVATVPTVTANTAAEVVDNSLENEMLRKYTAQNAKAGYKSQMLYHDLVAEKKNPKVFEPISIDSINRKAREDSLLAVTADSLRRINEEAMRSAEDARNAEIAQALKDQSQNTKYNFYVTKNGQFSVSFSTDKFYLNINQKGKIIDFAVMSNGSISAGSLQNRVTQIGNAKIVYNYRGNIDSIAGIQVTYTYDGRVNKVGNSYVSYNYEGIIEKVGEVPVIYNGNGTVFKFGNFGVSYNNTGTVVGIDDSSGLIVYRPMGDK